MFSLFSVSQNTASGMREVLSEYEYETRFVKLDSLEVSFIKEGSHSQTILFVHGLSSNADAWSKNIKVLSKQYSCVALDLPGFGKSSKVNTEHTPTFFAEVIHRFISELGLNQVVLVGHSMGGQAAMKLALTYPEDVSKLVLIAPAGIEQFSETESQLLTNAIRKDAVMQTSDEQIAKNYELNFYEMPGDVEKMIQDRKNIRACSDFSQHCEAISSSVRGMLSDPVFNSLSDIGQKTLVVFGEQDYLIPNKYLHPKMTTKEIAELAGDIIPNAQTALVEKAGHFVQFEKPAEVNALLTKFIESF